MLKIIELFSGIGAQVAALKRLGVDYEVVGISEIDKYAVKSYEAINGTTHNYGDITKIDSLDYADLWTYSFPCQDLSVAGRQAGIKEGARSGLLLHVERLLVESVLSGKQPKYLLLENVKALVSKKFKPDFDRWLDKLEQLGYNNYWQVLNAKDYGVPQNRERVFVVSIRKDVDAKGYKFPDKIPLTKRLKDVLEETVDEKYYLSDEKVRKFAENLKNKDISNTIRCGGGNLDGKHTWDLIIQKPHGFNKGGVHENAPTIVSNGSYQENNFVVEQVLSLTDKNHQQDRVYFSDGLCPTLPTMATGGNLQPKIIEPFIAAMRGRNPENPSDRTAGAPTEQRLEPNSQGISNTLTTVQKDNLVVAPEMRIRKLTPKECWRLMGFTDVEFECAMLSAVSNSQLYKQAGNSIVVDVLSGIFKNLFEQEVR